MPKEKGSESWTVRAHPNPDENRNDASFTAWLYEGMTYLTKQQKIEPKYIMAKGVEVLIGATPPPIKGGNTISERFDALESMLEEIQRQLQNAVISAGSAPKSKGNAKKVADKIGQISEQLSRALDVFSSDSEGDYDD
jgi:mevalonate kinase